MKLFKNIFFLLLVVFLFSSLLKNLFNYKSKLQFYQQFQLDYEKEYKRNIELKTKVVQKKSSEEVEKTIRNDLNLLKSNEIALIIPSPTSVPEQTKPVPQPNWKQWLDLFFKKE